MTDFCCITSSTLVRCSSSSCLPNGGALGWTHSARAVTHFNSSVLTLSLHCPLLQSIRTITKLIVSAVTLSLPFLHPALASQPSQPSAGGLRQEETNLCHETGEESPRIEIAIAEPAWDSHVARGDGGVGDLVPDMPGFIFGEDCQPVPVPSTLLPSTSPSNSPSNLPTNLPTNSPTCFGNLQEGHGFDDDCPPA